VGVDWFIGRIANFALPVEEIGEIVSSDNQRVGKCHLVIIRD